MLTTEILHIPSKLGLGRRMLYTVNCHDSIGINGITPISTAKTLNYKLCIVTLNLSFVSGFLDQYSFLTLSFVIA